MFEAIQELDASIYPPETLFFETRSRTARFSESWSGRRLLHVVQSPDDCLNFFNLSKCVWDRLFNQKKVLAVLSQPQNLTSAAVLEDLKEIRLAGNLLKSGYCLFDARHCSPEPFHLFVRYLGRLKDAMVFSQEAATAAPASYCRQILESQDMNSVLEEYLPADIISHRNFLSNSCAAGLAVLCQSEVTIQELHGLRKGIMRHLMQLYQLDAMRNSGHNIDAYGYIRILYDRVSAIVNSTLESSITKNDRIIIPEELSQNIAAVFDSFV